MLLKTDTEYAPWNIVEAVDKRFATAKIYSVVAKILDEKVRDVKEKKKAVQQAAARMAEMPAVVELEKADRDIKPE